MEILLILITIILGVYVILPLFRKSGIQKIDVKSEIQSLRREKISLKEALEELELEISTGVIDEREAAELKESYERRLNEIEKEIERIVISEVEKRKKRRR